jgi:hypothetical protein
MLGSNYQTLKNIVNTTNTNHENHVIVKVRDAYSNKNDDNSIITMKDLCQHGFSLHSWQFFLPCQHINFENKDRNCILEFIFLTNEFYYGSKLYKSYWIENDNKPFNIVNCL